MYVTFFFFFFCSCKVFLPFNVDGSFHLFLSMYIGYFKLDRIFSFDPRDVFIGLQSFFKAHLVFKT